MMGATFNGNSCTTVVSCFSVMKWTPPTSIMSDPFLSDTYPNNILIISGDTNDHIGKDRNNIFC